MSSVKRITHHSDQESITITIVVALVLYPGRKKSFGPKKAKAVLQVKLDYVQMSAWNDLCVLG